MNRMLQRTLRGITEHLYLTAVGSGVIAAALLLLGSFGLIIRNLDGIVSAWNQDAHVSAYFRMNTPPEVQIAAQQAVATRPEVISATHVTEEEATAWIRAQMPDLVPILDDLGTKVLPASLEITLRPERVTPADLEAFTASLMDSGSFEMVDYGRDWVGRLDTFLSLVRGMGVVLGGLTAFGTLFLVANTVHLAIYARRDELAIMRLVGATDGYIVGPFALEGAIQGLIGAAVAVAALYVLHGALYMRVGGLLPVAMGQEELHFLPIPVVVLLLLAGPLGGASVNTLATIRFLRQLS